MSSSTEKPPPSPSHTTFPSKDPSLTGDLETPTHPPALDSQPTTSQRKDGGVKAFVTLFGAFLTVFVVFGTLNTYGAFQSWYEDNQLKSHSPSAISWIGSLQLCMFFISGLIVGPVCDIYGPRPPLIAGGILFSFSLMMTSISKRYYQFLLTQGILNGFAIGVSFYPCLISISHHFEKYKATAMGIALTGGGIGGLVFPIMLSRLFNSIGFGWTVRILGFIILAALALSLLTISPDVPDPSPHKAKGPKINLRYFRDLKYMLFTLGVCAIVLGFYVPSTYIVQYSQDHGLQEHLAFESLSVINGLSLVGRTIIPLLADLFGKFNVLSLAAIVQGVAVLTVWLQATTSAAILGFAAFYGVFYGSVPVIVPACVAQISESHETGARIGLLYAFLGIPALIGPPIGGAILQHQHGSFDGMIIFSGVFLVFGGFLVVVVRMLLCKKLSAKV